MNGLSVGTLVAEAKNQIWFEYAPEWIVSGFDLSPQTLAFSTKPQLARDNLFSGLHGVFYDSLPDGWGLLLMDRTFKSRYDCSYRDITPLDRLAYIGSRAMGALEYAPEYDQEPVPDEVDLGTMAASSEAVLEGSETEVLAQLRIQGGSPGGARPKVTIARSDSNPVCLSGFGNIFNGYTHWIVKFRSKDDAPDMGCREKAYSEMARLAGIDMPPTDIIQIGAGKTSEKFFAVRRFDRDAAHNGRHHVLSLAGFIYANFRAPCIDYESVLQATSFLTRNSTELEKAFRLMVFNILSHNKDDHAKNFSFIGSRQGWRLSPGFDLTFSSGMNNEHTTAISGHGNPGMIEVIKLAHKFHLHRAEQIIGEVRYATTQWDALAKESGVTQTSANEIKKALAVIDHRFSQVPLQHYSNSNSR
jgi:serine/threonine-protein kinase HipA